MSIKKEQAITFIDEKSKMLTGMSDFLWDHPEIGYHETKAAKLFCETLQQEGFTVERPLAGIPTAFSGTFGSGAPIIGFLGEFDALPGLSQAAQCPEKRLLKLVVPGRRRRCRKRVYGA